MTIWINLWDYSLMDVTSIYTYVNLYLISPSLESKHETLREPNKADCLVLLTLKILDKFLGILDLK